MADRSKTNDAPIFVRAATLSLVGEGNAARNVVFSTGAKVRRYSWFRDEAYDEELSLDPAHVRLGRLNGDSGVRAPFLADHYARTDSVIGSVVPGSAKIAGGQGRAQVTFTGDESAQPTIRKIEEGHLGVSIGYRVHKMERTPPLKDGDVALYRAVDWEPYEISAVAIGADAGAGFRADEAKNPIEIIETRADALTQEVLMDDKEKAAAEEAKRQQDKAAADAAAAAAAASAAAAEAEGKTRAAAIKAERERIAEINSIGRVAKLEEAFVREHIDAGTSVEKFREVAFAKLAEKSAEGGEVRTHVQVVRDEVDTRRALAENAVLHRIDPKANKLEDGAREFRGLTLFEMARDLCERRGIRTRGLGRFELAGVALGLRDGGDGVEGTSDLANILANVMNKTLRRQYDTTPRTFTAWANPSTNPDFKTITRTVLSGAPSLLQVNGGGEYKRGAVTDGKETYSLATYGRTVAFSRQALINDDLSALSRVPSLMGRAAADLESDTVYAVLTANANLADGAALFNTTALTSAGGHANLAGSGGAISVTTLGAGRKAMRVQVGLEGRLINIVPAYLIVPSTQEQLAYQFTSSQFTPTQASNINEFRKGGLTALTPIVEPRLDASSTTQWYLSADPAQIDTVEYCYLEGNEGVYTETRVGFDVDGIEMKVRHDFAAKALDFRGLYANPGA